VSKSEEAKRLEEKSKVEEAIGEARYRLCLTLIENHPTKAGYFTIDLANGPLMNKELARKAFERTKLIIDGEALEEVAEQIKSKK